MFLKDSSGKQSMTATLFLIGGLVCVAKLLFSGMVIFGFQVPVFSGSEFGVAIGALGGVYTLRRNFGSRKEEDEK
jgi:hypothetical protein